VDDCANVAYLVMGIRRYFKASCPQDKDNCQPQDAPDPLGVGVLQGKIKSKGEPNTVFVISSPSVDTPLIDGLEVVIPSTCDAATRINAWCECREFEDDSTAELLEFTKARTPARAASCLLAGYANPKIGEAYKFRTNGGYHYGGVILRFGPFTVTLEAYSALERVTTVGTYYFGIYPTEPQTDSVALPTFFEKYADPLKIDTTAVFAVKLAPSNTPCGQIPIDTTANHKLGNCKTINNNPLFKCAIAKVCDDAAGFTKDVMKEATDPLLFPCFNCLRTIAFADRAIYDGDDKLSTQSCKTIGSKVGYPVPTTQLVLRSKGVTACGLV